MITDSGCQCCRHWSPVGGERGRAQVGECFHLQSPRFMRSAAAEFHCRHWQPMPHQRHPQPEPADGTR